MAKIHFDITGDNSNLVSTLNDSTKRLEHFSSLMKDLGSAGLDMSNPKAQLKSLEIAIKDNEKVIKDYEKQIRELEKAQKEAALAGNTGEVQAIGQQISDLGSRMQTTIDETNQLKSAYNELSTEMNQSSGVMVKLLGGQEKYNTIISQLPAGLRSVISGINGMTGAAKAFIATPLGAVIAALVLAFQALSTWLNKTAEGQQVLARVTGYLSGVLAGLMNVVKQVGKELYDAFNNPKDALKSFVEYLKNDIVSRVQALGGMFKNLGEIIKATFSGDFDTVKEKITELGGNAKAAFLGTPPEELKEIVNGIHEIGKAESELNARRNKLHRERSAWAVKESELDMQIAEARNKMYSGSTAEREAAAAKAEALINQKYAQRIKFAKEEYEIKKASNALTNSSQEELDEENRLLAAVNQEKASRQSALAMFTRRGHTAEEAGIKAAQQEEDALTALMFQNEEKRIAMIEDEGEREAEAINLKYKKAMAEIAKTRREWEERNRLNTGDSTLSQEQEDALAEAEELAGEEMLKTTTDNLDALVKKYATYEDKRKQIIEDGEKEAKRLRDAGFEEQAKEVEKATAKELNALDRQNKDIYKRLAQDTSKWGVVAINKAIQDAQEEIDRLSETPEMATANADAIDYLTGKIEGLKNTVRNFSFPNVLKMLLGVDTSGGKSGAGTGSLAERFNALREAWGEMTAEQKWQSMGGYITKIGSGLQKAAGYMKEIADISGDSHLADTADQLSAIGQNLSAAGQGAASGGGWGALAAGLTDLLGQTVEAFAYAGRQEAIAARNAEDWADAIERMAAAVKEADFATIFGDKGIAKAQANFKSATEYMRLYYKEIDKLNKKYNIDNAEDFIKGNNFNDTTSRFLAYQDIQEKGLKGLQTMLVTTKKATGWAKFWGGADEYTALGSLAPQLWKNGEFDVEAAKEFLKVNTQLTDEQRKQIENLVELKEGYDEAMKAVDDAISDTFGNLASDITDIIWDSVMNGTDAWEEFEKVGSEAIASLGKQLIQEMLISEYLEQYRDQMRKAYQSGSAEETQAQLRNIIGDIYGGMENMLAAGTLVAEEYKAWADEHGFDLTKLSASSQTAKAGGFEVMSQDTANELNGRFTALQISNELISQSAQEGLTYIITISDLVRDGNSALSDIRQLHTLELAHLEDISKYTKAMVGFGETLDKIKENTDRL